MKTVIMPKPEIHVILHNVRSLYNVGSFFRTCDGAGVHKLYLTGYSGFPPRKEISKTALGAEDVVPWEYHWEIGPVLQRLRAEGVQLVAVEAEPGSYSYLEAPYRSPVCLIFGSEVTGVMPETQAMADFTVQVPMFGQKNSLNVAVCGGIVMYAVQAKLTANTISVPAGVCPAKR